MILVQEHHAERDGHVTITLRVILVQKNHAERDDYLDSVTITLRVIYDSEHHAERDDYLVMCSDHTPCDLGSEESRGA